MPIMAYIKNSMAISKQTYGSALNDCTKVQRRMRIVYPWRSNFIRRAARNKRRKPTLIEFDCKILLVKGRKREKQKIWRVVLEWLCPGNFSSTRSSVRIWFQFLFILFFFFFDFLGSLVLSTVRAVRVVVVVVVEYISSR